MGNIALCEQCKSPLIIGKEFSWDNSGAIKLGDSFTFRWAFAESDDIDNLFTRLEELIGLPLMPIIVESRRREARKYMEMFAPSTVRQFLDQSRGRPPGGNSPDASREEMEILQIARSATATAYDLARLYGYGDLRHTGSWDNIYDLPWRTTSVRNPYSIPMVMAETLSGIESLEKTDMRSESEKTGENEYIFRCFEDEHPVQLEGMLKVKTYTLKPGDITYQYCPGCGLPVEVAAYNWDLENGTIHDPSTDRRMAIYGPYSIESVLNDLEAELGKAIEELVIEAQRKSIKGLMSSENWLRRAPDYKHLLSVRGFGNLVDFGGDKTHVSLTIENSCMHLRMVGIVQGIVELAMKWDSSMYEYDLQEDGDLSITIKI